MDKKNTGLLVLVLVLIVGSIVFLEKNSPSRTQISPKNVTQADITLANNFPKNDSNLNETQERQEQKKKIYPLAKEIVGVTGYINTKDDLPIKIQNLIGKKVILLDIWTYSCINCQRTLPYLKSWYEKYKDQGLEVIGLHVPEFEFEKDIENVKSAVSKFGITYPVVLDSNASTARVYGMKYWPEEYLIDIDGFIVHKSIGEGQYVEKEAKIRELLEERMRVLGEKGEIKSSPVVVETVSVPTAESPETYFGALRNNLLGNGDSRTLGDQSLVLPKEFSRNVLYLAGDWNFSKEFAQNSTKNATIVFRYKSKEVYFVASSVAGTKIKIYQDGVLVSASKGDDVDKNGEVFVKEDRLYKLIKNKGLEEHVLRIEIENSGLEAYTFTFG